MRAVSGWSNGPVTVVLSQADLRLLVAALDEAEGSEARELRDALATLIGDAQTDN